MKGLIETNVTMRLELTEAKIESVVRLRIRSMDTVIAGVVVATIVIAGVAVAAVVIAGIVLAAVFIAGVVVFRIATEFAQNLLDQYRSQWIVSDRDATRL